MKQKEGNSSSTVVICASFFFFVFSNIQLIQMYNDQKKMRDKNIEHAEKELRVLQFVGRKATCKMRMGF